MQVHAAFSIVEQMCRLDMALPVEILYPIIHAVDESCELDLVHCAFPSANFLTDCLFYCLTQLSV